MTSKQTLQVELKAALKEMHEKRIFEDDNDYPIKIGFTIKRARALLRELETDDEQ